MKTLTSLTLIAIALTASVQAEAGSKQSCPVPGGVKCMSPVDVYRATDSLSSLEFIQTKKQENQLKASLNNNGIAMTQQGLLLQPMTAEELAAPKPGLFQRKPKPLQPLPAERVNPVQPVTTMASGAEPYRMPAQVMRIWVAPWEDEAGDLHMPSYVFTEIEARRWTVAEPAPDLVPELRLITPSTAESTTPTEN